MIIAFTGYIGSGKSFFSKILVERGFIEYAFAFPLKEMGKNIGFNDNELYGTQDEKNIKNGILNSLDVNFYRK